MDRKSVMTAIILQSAKKYGIDNKMEKMMKIDIEKEQPTEKGRENFKNECLLCIGKFLF